MFFNVLMTVFAYSVSFCFCLDTSWWTVSLSPCNALFSVVANVVPYTVLFLYATPNQMFPIFLV